MSEFDDILQLVPDETKLAPLLPAIDLNAKQFVSLDVISDTLGAQNIDEAKEIITKAYNYGLFVRDDVGLASVLADLDLTRDIDRSVTRTLTDILDWVSDMDSGH